MIITIVIFSLLFVAIGLMVFSYGYIGVCGYMTQLFDNSYYRFPSFNDIAQMSRNGHFMTIEILILVITIVVVVSWLITVLIKGYAYYSLFAIIYLGLGIMFMYGVAFKYRTILLLELELPTDLVIIYALMISSCATALVTYLIKMVNMFIKPIQKIYVTSTSNIVLHQDDKK